MSGTTNGGAAGVEERIRAAYDAFHRRDIDAILSYFSSDVVWVHPDGMELAGLGGAKHGHAGMREFLGRVPQVLGGMVLDPHEFLVSGDRVIVLGDREVTSREGRKETLRFVQTWTLGEDGLAVHFEDYFDTVEMFRLIDPESVRAPIPGAAG
ncbi:nuclear transport factor 2 family protein [Streptomyces luteolus]|uniref:Nuclear transport factor 2 family protein n=1 Tax=Streptomyces luteolus TaxID=3043615 RepID=A0ABT6T2K7_9ACTN|nr:nuclear transport factor 2 family protein [Streptomyces sp. B-S-A12]MDI3422098.1 nuclear transport factor 2 family protein [Streptomyces sp. B-S-A12]